MLTKKKHKSSKGHRYDWGAILQFAKDNPQLIQAAGNMINNQGGGQPNQGGEDSVGKAISSVSNLSNAISMVTGKGKIPVQEAMGIPDNYYDFGGNISSGLGDASFLLDTTADAIRTGAGVDTDTYIKQARRFGNTGVSASNTSDLVNQWGSRNYLKKVDKYDITGGSLFGDIVGGVASNALAGYKGFSQGASSGNVKKGIAFGILGSAINAIGQAIGAGNTKDNIDNLNWEINAANKRQTRSYMDAAERLRKQQLATAMYNSSAYGGPINIPIQRPAEYDVAKDANYNKQMQAQTEGNSSFTPIFNSPSTYSFEDGGGIHIKPSKRGTFTAAAKKHGKSVQEFASQVLANKENYSPAMVKKANFARNAAGWKHAYGGPNGVNSILFSGLNLPEDSVANQAIQQAMLQQEAERQARRDSLRQVRRDKIKDLVTKVEDLFTPKTTKEDSQKFLNRPSISIFPGLNVPSESVTNNTLASGGMLMSDYFNNGVTMVDQGGTHENNPHEGVQMGVAPDGKPNLVEEGEAIYKDYVFSNRLRVPKEVRNKYKLRGPKDMTFAEAFRKAQEESEERPNDPISEEGLENIAMVLARTQEAVRGYEKSGRKAAEGGHLFSGEENQSELQRRKQMLLEDRLISAEQQSNPSYYADLPIDAGDDEIDDGVDELLYDPDEIKERYNPDEVKKGRKFDLSNLRYADVLANAGAVFSDMMGLTNNPTLFDYVPPFQAVGYNPIGNYIPVTHFDTRYAANLAAQQAAATRRAIMQSTLPSRYANLLAADYNAQIANGDLLMKAALDDYDRTVKREEFNRGTNQTNSQLGLQAAMANQDAALKYGQSALQQAKMNEDSSNLASAARATNLGNLAESISNIGREEDARKRADWLIDSDIYGTLNEKGIKLKYDTKKEREDYARRHGWSEEDIKAANFSRGGKIRKRKKGLTY